MINVFLLLGSNLGDRNRYLQTAITLVEEQIAAVTLRSSVYETQSWGKSDAPDYLNQVIAIQTDLPAPVILKKILNIELSLGRERLEKWGSRTIDIDILFYGDRVIHEANLVVPHPALHQREFTLAPLAEIAPDFVHPVLKKNILTIKTELKNELNVKKL